MYINGADLFRVSFRGQRQDRNTLTQLKYDNDYDLNLPNQRRINKAIENLAQIKGEENVRFLLDLSEGLRYGTSINLDKKSYNDWKKKLNDAAEHAMNISDENVRAKYAERLKQARGTLPYTDEEKSILKEREKLLGQINFKDIEKIKSKNIKNIKTNLDYFVISSEVPTSQKLYILKRLNHFMSDDYEINPQLKDKKNQALAEIINDIVVDTPESNIPNSKEINQLHHGICASISICRKYLAYEDKPNYVDMILSELDNNENMMVYDINKLGSKTKIPVPKIYVDFETAMDRGYRIVDTSAMYWMNVADTIGANNEAYGFYSPIDSNYFDVFTDAHMINDISKELADKHDYYRGLVKAKSIIGEYKAQVEKNKFLNRKKHSEEAKNITISGQNSRLLRSYIYEIAGENVSEKQISNILADLKHLEVKNSDAAKKVSGERKKYIYLRKEEMETKKEKIENFLAASLPDADIAKIKSKSEEIATLIEDINPDSNAGISSVARYMRDVRSLYQAAAAYRTQQILQLSIPEYRKNFMIRFNLPNKESNIIKNIESLIEKIDNKTITPVLQKKLADNLKLDNDSELIKEVLQHMKEQVETVTTNVMDEFYHSISLVNKNHALAVEIEYTKNMLDLPENKDMIKDFADDFNLEPTKKAVQQYLQEQIKILESDSCPQEKYLELFDKFGPDSQISFFIDNYTKIGNLIFKEKLDDIRKGFNLLNGLPEDADIEETKEAFLRIATEFDNMDSLLGRYYSALNISDEINNNVLNSADVRYDIIANLELIGDMPKEEDLQAFRRRFTQIDKLLADKENDINGYSDLPKSYTALSKEEKQAIKQYRSNINSWYAIVLRRLNNQYRDFKDEYEEHCRNMGVKSGHYWVMSEGDSGLYPSQEIKIIEHMTDRPYYEEDDGERAFHNIKNGVYSGISSTSVDHTRPAMHAQYIADVVPLKTKNGETRDVVFHDNSWGAAEFENIWRDKDGFIRTDYARDFGGELGYITNAKYLNGNFQENILNKVGEYKTEAIESHMYNKINPRGADDFRFPLLSDVIAYGTPPHIEISAGGLKNHFLISPFKSLPDLQKYSSERTTAQIKKDIAYLKTVGDDFDKVFDDYMKKIAGIKPFDNGLATFEDYNKLPKNNEVRLMLDKLAVLKSYDNVSYDKDLSYVKNQGDIEKIRQKITKEAEKDFYYTFAKNPDIRNYIAYSSKKEIASAIDNWVKTHNIVVDAKKLRPVLDNMFRIQSKNLDGSMINTLNLIIDKFEKNISSATPEFNNKALSISELKNEVMAILIKNNYMTEKDTLNIPNIENWIDKTFAPATNEEFVRIVNNLRDMTTQDFNSLYKTKITNSDLGIKNITGYDILKKLRAENTETVNEFYNQIYQDEIYKNIVTGETKTQYDYNKFSKLRNGTLTYVGVNDKTFDDIYTEYNSAISLLHLNKLFNTWKNENFRKYGAMPAYPTVPLRENEDLEKEMANMFDKLNDYMSYVYSYNSQIQSMAIVDKLNNILSNYQNKNTDLSYEDFEETTSALQSFVKTNLCDETLKDLSDEVSKIIDSGEMSVQVYRYITDKIDDNISAYRTTLYGETMEEVKAETLKNLQAAKEDILNQLFIPRYKNRAAEILNKWIAARIKVSKGDMSMEAVADKYYNEFVEYYDTHSILDKPEKLLEEFMLLNAKDSELNNPNTPEERKQEFEDRNQLLSNALKGILLKANIVELQMLVMNYKRHGKLNAVADAFKKSQIELIDGSFIPVASPEGISLLFSPLLSKDNTHILADFFNELGLSETFVEAIEDDTQFEDARKNIKRMHSILKSLDTQIGYINKQLKTLEDIDSSDDYHERIEEFGKNIAAKVKQTTYRKSGKVYEAAIEEILNKMESSPNISKNLILNADMNVTMNAIVNTVKKDISLLSEDLKQLGEIERILSNLHLPENSEAKIKADKYIAQCNELIEYQKKFPTYYPNAETSIH